MNAHCQPRFAISCENKRQRTAAVQDTGARAMKPQYSARFWRAPLLWRFERVLLLTLAAILLAAASLTAASFVPLTLTEPAGVARSNEIVTSGLPFPMGALKTVSQLRLLDEEGRAVPLQVQATATWRDGSVKWALLDFPATVPANGTARFKLETGAAQPEPPPATSLRIKQLSAGHFVLDTGRLEFQVSRSSGIGQFRTPVPEGAPALPHNARSLRAFVAGRSELPPEVVELEAAGPLRAVVKLSGWLDAGANRPPVFKYLWRLTVRANSPALQAQLTVTQMGRTNKLEMVSHFGLRLEHDAPPGPLSQIGGVGTETGATFPLPHELRQLTESQFECQQGATVTRGLRAPGWAAWSSPRGCALIAIQHFWQQYPKALRLDQEAVTAELYAAAAKEPLDWDQGLAKTHEFLLDFAAPPDAAACAARVQAFEHPLLALAPAQWYCASGVFGDLAPFNFDLFPDYETLTEASGDKFIKSMATGIRNWGDFYYGGPYKGKNSFMDLEYDLPHNFLVQFARTGQRKYLDTARIMAQHQADIDINHFTGWQWKHSPRHTEIQAEFGHTFTRGLLENYFFTGNRRCLEAAITLGDFFAQDIRNPRSLGNERQIGWALISLLPVYEATWDRKYFDAAKETVDRLLAGLDERGKFNIRWDNRIAFFNGIAATGFLYYYRATGDERVADGALRVIRRTLGMYPEYCGRTLEALAWAYQRTGDPNFLDALKLSYESTMSRAISWNALELGAPTIFTVHALPFMEKSGLVKAPPKSLQLTPAQFASENGTQVHHLPAGAGEIYFQVEDAAPLTLMLVRKGAWKAAGRAVLYDPFGKAAHTLEFPRESAIWQREFITVPKPLPGTWRLALTAPQIANVRAGAYITWDVATSRPTKTVLATENHAGLEFVTPRLFLTPKPGETNLVLELAGEGEGFKKAVLYDPEGNTAGIVQAFVDLGDQGRYGYRLSAPIPPAHADGIWSLSLQDGTVTKISGLKPYFATSRAAFFQPDRPPQR